MKREKKETDACLSSCPIMYKRGGGKKRWKKERRQKKVSGRVSERDKERVFKGVSKQQNGSPPHTLRSIMIDTA